MLSLFRDTWPFFGLIAVVVVPMLLGEVVDYFFPGHGWMIVAYAIGAFGVIFMLCTLKRNW